MLQELPKKFNHRDFPELKGFRITTKIIPSKYDKTGRILDWTVEYLRWPEEVEAGVQAALRQRSKKSFCNSTVRHSVPMEGGSGTNGIMKGSIGL